MKAWTYAALLALLALPGAASAHEVWIERDGTGPARIYLGEPAEPLPPGGDPEFAHLKAPHVLGAGKATQARKAGFIEVAMPAGDVRAWDDDVFAPWGEAGRKEGVVYYARAGRADPRTKLPLEIAPLAANGDRFRLVQGGRPLAGTEVTIIAPDRVTARRTTDRDGAFAVPVAASGRYVLTAAVKDDRAQAVPGGKVAVLHRITTTSFTVP